MTTPRVTVPVETTPDLTNEQIQSVMLEAIREVRATVTDHVEAATMDADIARMERGPVDLGTTGWEVMRAVHRRLAALATREEAPAEAGEIDLYDDKVQAGIAWTMRQWGETLGLKTWDMGDGSESVEGDVGAEIHTILVDAGLRDPETNEMAALRAQPPAREGAQPVADADRSEWISDARDFTERMTGQPMACEIIERLLEIIAHPAPDALRVAVEGIDADYMTSETHYPGYVLIPTIKFDTIRAALQAEQGAK